MGSTVSDYHRQPSQTIIDKYLRLSQTITLDYLRHYLRLPQTAILDYIRQLPYTILHNKFRLILYFIGNFLRLNQSTLLYYLRLVYMTILRHLILNNVRQLSIIFMAILGNYKDNFDMVSKQSQIPILNNIGQIWTIGKTLDKTI